MSCPGAGKHMQINQTTPSWTIKACHMSICLQHLGYIHLHTLKHSSLCIIHLQQFFLIFLVNEQNNRRIQIYIYTSYRPCMAHNQITACQIYAVLVFSTISLYLYSTISLVTHGPSSTNLSQNEGCCCLVTRKFTLIMVYNYNLTYTSRSACFFHNTYSTCIRSTMKNSIADFFFACMLLNAVS